MNMKQRVSLIKNEDGSVLVIAMLILVLLTLIGIAATNTSIIEMQIAGNEKLHKMAFYAADSGTEVGTELLEQNVSCPAGFTDTGGGEAQINQVTVTNLAFWQNTSASQPSDANRDLFYPTGNGTVNITAGGQTVMAVGGALQMVAGYEGKGKGAGAGGSHILYDIFSQYIGSLNETATIKIQWRHLIGQEGSCNY
jgi:Tfp pilus assembly protein PilX